ncbi:MAG: helix-turn-helix transcriptional regulator, partial [Lentisphaerae bacterium]|nr:helix-turn-helix transcriptional regulator [Lentisphaerota bacterium]
EKWVEPGTSYTMLWLTLLPQGVNLHFSAYSPQTGYHLAGERLTFQVPSAASLWEASTHPDLTDNIPAQAHFLSQLLQSLVEVLDGLENPAESPLPYAQQLAEQVKHYLDAHFRSDVTLQALAEMVHYSPAHLNAVFRRHVGSPIHRYLLDQRLKHAKKLLAQPGSSIKQAARESGFNDPLYFSRLFRRRTGVNPREFQLQLREQRT